jgi:hypothetical protein
MGLAHNRKQSDRHRAKKSPGAEEAGRLKPSNGTQWVQWNPTRERLATPGSEFCSVVSK